MSLSVTSSPKPILSIRAASPRWDGPSPANPRQLSARGIMMLLSTIPEALASSQSCRLIDPSTTSSNFCKPPFSIKIREWMGELTRLTKVPHVDTNTHRSVWSSRMVKVSVPFFWYRTWRGVGSWLRFERMRALAATISVLDASRNEAITGGAHGQATWMVLGQSTVVMESGLGTKAGQTDSVC
ncbi:uncharacterized protein BJ171DRAFT_158299 [Polychytrium aggregatum]|uniref:uncharacterized protein n=1 Tax=Polychytrium aggregatum TaxID=110093 RepID=UPI0022FED9D0|nr:uncharacterized protein BJ171DRAFT_158299 [Polychytrium aggregatum]KAI9203027.1 hypothetical protein BJ171DRAFT_158299 [Polychytrium aggregatum]